LSTSLSSFSDLFLIDTSTLETIDTGFKNIASVKNAGDSSQAGVNWLRNEHNGWLLLLDNADDPKIDLNKFLPRCNHGNIIITSRNPGLCVYAGSQFRVSDMGKTDAAELLLKISAQESTPTNKEAAVEIVKVSDISTHHSLYPHNSLPGLVLSPSCHYPGWSLHCKVGIPLQLSGTIYNESSSTA
jgi:hypothetical protein